GGVWTNRFVHTPPSSITVRFRPDAGARGSAPKTAARRRSGVDLDGGQQRGSAGGPASEQVPCQAPFEEPGGPRTEHDVARAFRILFEQITDDVVPQHEFVDGVGLDVLLVEEPARVLGPETF